MIALLMLAVVPGLVVPTLPVIGIQGTTFTVNGRVTYPGKQAQGRLLNVRMANAIFEDTNINPSFDAESNADEFIAQCSSYLSAGVRAFTLSLQGGNPGYENAVNTAINANGSLKSSYMDRAKRVIEAIGQRGGIVILGIYYQRQDQHVTPTGQTDTSGSIGTGVTNVATWIRENRLTNVLLEIANEYPHAGFDHSVITSESGMASLINLAKAAAPGLKVGASGLGDGTLGSTVAGASDYLSIHFNDVTEASYATLIGNLTSHGKPILCTEDSKTGSTGASAAQTCLDQGASWGFHNGAVNQDYPFAFGGVADDLTVYAKLRELATT